MGRAHRKLGSSFSVRRAPLQGEAAADSELASSDESSVRSGTEIAPEIGPKTVPETGPDTNPVSSLLGPVLSPPPNAQSAFYFVLGRWWQNHLWLSLPERRSPCLCASCPVSSVYSIQVSAFVGARIACKIRVIACFDWAEASPLP